MIVFKRGIIRGLNLWIPIGGHIIPSSIDCVSLKWKNLQKKDKKNKISDVIKRIIPIFIPINTFNEWSPWNVLSRVISRHHWIIIIIVNNKPIIIILKFFV